ncbi:MAG TPA: hypothetical protein VHD83_21315 [Puia sp.]|nr:hypothetical protein [Puia sp.]
MKKKGLLKGLLLMATVWFVLPGRGQAQDAIARQDSFAYKAPLYTIERAGWYKIPLTPAIVAKSKENLSDIRIADPYGKLVPYVLQAALPLQGMSASVDFFIEFPILLSQKEADTYTNVVVRNISTRPVNSLQLYIRNTGVRRLFTLSGSDDRDHWYIIKEHIALGPGSADSTTYYIQRIDLPASNYKYFKVSQEGKGLPIQIVKMGTTTQHIVSGESYITPAPAIFRKDSGDHTYITLTYKEPYIVDELILPVSSPALYRRKAKIYDKERSFYGVNVIIDPANDHYLLPPFKTREIMIEINNGDNPPLVIDKIVSTQGGRYLLSYLQPGQGYQLLAGNDKAAAPQYDLQSFADTIDREPPSILPGTLTAVGRPSPSPAKDSSRDYKGVYLWTAIVVVLILLIWLCLNMLRSIRGSRE